MTSRCASSLPDVLSPKSRTTIVHQTLYGADASLFDKVKAHIGLSLLLTWWIGGCISPLILVILVFLGYYKTVCVALMIAAIPYVVKLESWTFLRWFFGRGISHFAYYAPYGVACYYMTGAREAIMTQTEEDYKRRRDARRKGLQEPDNADSLPDHKPFVLTINPHGIFPMTFWQAALCNPDVFRINPNITYLVSSVLTKAPFWTYFHGWIAQMSSASKENMTRLMKERKDIGLIPGGFEEASLYEWGKHKLYLKNRAGFIKYCLQYGYDIVPIYSFGEELSYVNLPGGERIRLWLNRFQIPGVIPFGKCLLLPFNDHRLNVFFGSPVRLPHIPSPTAADVAQWHAVYVDRIKELFEASKGIAEQPDAQLEIL